MGSDVSLSAFETYMRVISTPSDGRVKQTTARGQDNLTLVRCNHAQPVLELPSHVCHLSKVSNGPVEYPISSVTTPVSMLCNIRLTAKYVCAPSRFGQIITS